MNFDTLKLNDEQPIYPQIVDYIKRQIIAGEIRSGDVMPSRRVLSAALGVNPNTMQKAFKQLESDGIVYSKPGAKSVITIDDQRIQQIKDELIIGELKYMLQKFDQMGYGQQEIKRLIGELWGELYE